MIIFGILNIIENLIHWNIGANSDFSKQFKSETIGYSHSNISGFKFNFPTKSDFLKIIGVMIIFGITQGILTELIVKD